MFKAFNICGKSSLMFSLPNNENEFTLLLLPHAKGKNLGSLKSASTSSASCSHQLIMALDCASAFLKKRIQQQRQAAAGQCS